MTSVRIESLDYEGRGVTHVDGKTIFVEGAITGRAWITGFKQYVLDPTDPFPLGYTLTDTWPKG